MCSFCVHPVPCFFYNRDRWHTYSSLSHFFFQTLLMSLSKKFILSRTMKSSCAQKLNTRNRWSWTITFHRLRQFHLSTHRKCISFAKLVYSYWGWKRVNYSISSKKKIRVNKRWIWCEHRTSKFSRSWIIDFILCSRSIHPSYHAKNLSCVTRESRITI